MPCNCGKSAQKQVWTWTSKDGSQSQEYGSQVQAQARSIREGGGKITSRTV